MAHARLKFYEALDTLQERVLYYDTDSVIYRWRPGQVNLPLGNLLGQFTDELGGNPIVEFVRRSKELRLPDPQWENRVQSAWVFAELCRPEETQLRDHEAKHLE